MAKNIPSIVKSGGALLAGMALIVILSIAADAAAGAAGVNPSSEASAQQDWRYIMPLGYRCLFAVFGSYVAAKLAPAAPLKHALALGAIGALLAMIGLVIALRDDFRPLWYPVALVLTAVPCAWVGGIVHRNV